MAYGSLREYGASGTRGIWGDIMATGLKRAFRASSVRKVMRNFMLATSIGALSAWFLMMFCSVTAYVGSFDGPEPALNRAYLAHAVAFALCCALLVRFNRSFDTLVDNEALALPLAVLLMIGSLILSYSSISQDTVWVLVCLGAVLTAAASCSFAGLIGHRFGKVAYRERLEYSVVGFGVCSLLFALFSIFARESAAAYAAACATIPGLAVFAFDRIRFAEEPNEEPEASDAAMVRERRLLFRFAALVFFWRAAVEWSRGILVTSGINEAGNSLFALIHGIGTVVVVVAALAIIVLMVSLPNTFRLSYAYRVVLVMSLCTVLITQAAEDPAFRVVPYALTSGTEILLLMISWAVGVSFIGFSTKSSSQVVLIVGGASYTGAAVGFHLSFLAGLMMPASPAIMTVINSIEVCMLVLLYLALFTERDVDFVSRLIPSKQHRRFAECCKELAGQYDLSPREAEILPLLAKGRNAAYVQEAMFISYNTATTHRKRIYQKMGVHSQQELMDIVDKVYQAKK